MEAERAVVAADENPDDAAVENVNGVAGTLPCVCHTQFCDPCEETPSILFPVALSCQPIVNYCYELQVDFWQLQHEAFQPKHLQTVALINTSITSHYNQAIIIGEKGSTLSAPTAMQLFNR